jgi:transcriptional regulator with XRE-family HTH domain
MLRRKFGAHVRVLRQARQLTQEALAERSDLSVDAVRRIERGGFSPSLDTLHKLSAGLQVSLQTLFDSFGHERRDRVAEICDFLSRRSGSELSVAWRVLRAMFDEGR